MGAGRAAARYRDGMFRRIGFGVAFPLFLASEAVLVLAVLESAFDGQDRVGLYAISAFVGAASFAALVVGYMLRDA